MNVLTPSGIGGFTITSLSLYTLEAPKAAPQLFRADVTFKVDVAISFESSTVTSWDEQSYRNESEM